MKYDVSAFVNPIKATATAAVNYANAHRPEGLIISGLIGWFGSLAAMYVQSPKIHKDLDDGDLKQAAKDILPVAIPVALSTTAQIKGVKEATDKYAAAYAFGKAAEEALRERKEAELTSLNEKKVTAINQQQAENAVVNNPPVMEQVVQIGVGTCLHYDKKLRRYFRADVEQVNKSLQHMRDGASPGSVITLADFYRDLGEQSIVADIEDDTLFDKLGWSVPEAKDWKGREVEDWEKPDADFTPIAFPSMDPVRVIDWRNLQFIPGYGEESIRIE